MNRTIIRLCKSDAFITSPEIKKEIKNRFDVEVSAVTVRRRRMKVELNGRIAKKKTGRFRK